METTTTTTATDILMEEHRVIEQVLACVDRMIQRYRTTGELNLEHARDAADFFRTFADQCHHAKEEAHLFPMIESKGFPRDGGPTGVMIHEHEEGRAHVRAMSAAVQAAASGNQAALGDWARNAAAYIELLAQHIQKEDHCLYPAANNALDRRDQQALLEIFDHVEHEEMGEGTHEKYLGIAQALAAAYKVAPAVAKETHQGHGCSHHRHG